MLPNGSRLKFCKQGRADNFWSTRGASSFLPLEIKILQWSIVCWNCVFIYCCNEIEFVRSLCTSKRCNAPNALEGTPRTQRKLGTAWSEAEWAKRIALHCLESGIHRKLNEMKLKSAWEVERRDFLTALPAFRLDPLGLTKDKDSSANGLNRTLNTKLNLIHSFVHQIGNFTADKGSKEESERMPEERDNLMMRTTRGGDNTKERERRKQRREERGETKRRRKAVNDDGK